MAQESISSILSTQPDVISSSSRPANQPESAGEGEDSFLSALNNVRLDEPKRGNKEPFFPQKPMPYHPQDTSQENNYGSGLTESPPMRHRPPVKADGQSAPVKEDRNADSVDDGSDADDSGTLNAGMQAQKTPDDRHGILTKSYDGAAVSYPVRQIASQSLDEKTKEELKTRGLWNLPAMIMAQPSAKVLAMKNVLKAAHSKQLAIPVQKPIAQFMASLESELGVKPDRLVKAIKSLSPGQLQLPPSQTMIQVVKNLGLKGQEQAKALQLYTKMLAQMEMLQEKQERIAVGGVKGAALAAAKLENQAEAQTVNQFALAKELQAPRSGTGQPGLTAKSAGHVKMAASALNSSAASASGTGTQPAQNSALKGIEMKNLMAQQSRNQEQNLAQNQNQGQSQEQGRQLLNQNAVQNLARHESAPVKEQLKFDLKHDLSAKTGGHDGGHPLVDVSSLSTGATPPDLKPAAMPGAAPAATAAALNGHVGIDSKHEAIQAIINNTQMLAHKGGGEIHMTLKPDHLGEIQLRVAMDGNRVQVHMTTDKGDVKKLIEQSVHELRHGLAQHNLSMEKLDVSVNDRNTGNFQGRQPDFGAARDFSRQFAQQQNGRRETFLGLSEMRANGAHRGMGLSSAAHEAPTARVRSRGAGRLNVVA